MNAQNRKELRLLCGGDIPPSVEAYFIEAAAALRRLKGGEFQPGTLVLLWMQAIREDEALAARLSDEGKVTQANWAKTKLVRIPGETKPGPVLVNEDKEVTVDWAGLNRHGKFVQVDPNSECHLLISIDDLKGDVQSIPMHRVRLTLDVPKQEE
ncbi:hypothetical protein HQ535_09605 [bacterium]|nr:hypothetical protein [bacterium]